MSDRDRRGRRRYERDHPYDNYRAKGHRDDFGPQDRYTAARFRHRTNPSLPTKRRADDDEDTWVRGEDKFVVEQSKKRAVLRLRAGRAEIIDKLAVVLRLVDPTDIPTEDDNFDEDMDIALPEAILQALDPPQLEQMKLDIDSYLTRETKDFNVRYWRVR